MKSIFSKLVPTLFVLILLSCNDNSEKESDLDLVSKELNQQELNQFAKEFFSNDYTFNRLNFTEGSLEQAFQQAKQQNKFLFVLTSIPDCSICDLSLKNLDINEEVNKETLDNFLFYKSDFSRNEDKYLLWALNSYSVPNAFIFNKDSKLINIANGAKGIRNKNLLTNIYNIENHQFSSRLNLKGQDAVVFINEQINTYKTLTNPKSTRDNLNNAHIAVSKTLEQEAYFFNAYLKQELGKKLGLSDKKISHSEKVKQSFIKDKETKILYETLMQ